MGKKYKKTRGINDKYDDMPAPNGHSFYDGWHEVGGKRYPTRDYVRMGLWANEGQLVAEAAPHVPALTIIMKSIEQARLAMLNSMLDADDPPKLRLPSGSSDRTIVEICFHRRANLKQPRVPGFVVYLHNRSNKVYRPGDAAEGYIFLTPAQTMKLASIGVSQLGRSTVHGSQNANPVDKALLLELTMNTVGLTTPFVEPGRTYDFTFSFRFPTSTSNRRLNYDDICDQRWTTEPHRPPSMFWN